MLKKWFNSGKLKREDIFITTKLPPQGVHPDRVEQFTKLSLEKLQLDYIDLYIIHFPMFQEKPGDKYLVGEVGPTDLLATWKKLEEQVDLGRVKSIGVSNFNEEQVGRIISNSRIKPASNEIELHVYLQQPQLVKYCQDNGIVVVSYFSLGNLGYVQLEEKRGKKTTLGFGKVLTDPTVLQIADKHKRSPAQILLKFLVQKNIAVIPKSVTPGRIKENISLFDFILDKDDIKALEGLDKGEEGRLLRFDFRNGIVDHPEYPFPRRNE